MKLDRVRLRNVEVQSRMLEVMFCKHLSQNNIENSKPVPLVLGLVSYLHGKGYFVRAKPKVVGAQWSKPNSRTLSRKWCAGQWLPGNTTNSVRTYERHSSGGRNPKIHFLKTGLTFLFMR